MVNLDYLYNPAAAKPLVNTNYFVDKKLGFQVIENGMILPCKKVPTAKTPLERLGCGGVVRDNGEYVKGSFITHQMDGVYIPPRIN